MSRYASWLRWPLLPPLSLGAAYLAAAVIAFVDSAGGVVAYAAAFVTGVVFLWAALLTAHAVAPSHKRIAVTVLGLFILGDMAFVHLVMPRDFFQTVGSEGGMSWLLGLLRADHYDQLPNGGAVLVVGVALGLATALWKLRDATKRSA